MSLLWVLLVLLVLPVSLEHLGLDEQVPEDLLVLLDPQDLVPPLIQVCDGQTERSPRFECGSFSCELNVLLICCLQLSVSPVHLDPQVQRAPQDPQDPPTW